MKVRNKNEKQIMKEKSLTGISVIKPRKNRRKMSPIPPHLLLTNFVVDQTPSDSRNLLPWAVWYLNKEVRGVKATLTSEAQQEDIQKLVVFFYKYFPGGEVSKWDKATTRSFLDFLTAKKYSSSSVARIRGTLVTFANYLIRKGLIPPEEHPTEGVKPTIRESSFAPQSLQAEDDGKTIMEGTEVFNLLLDTVKIELRNTKRHKRALPYRDISLLTTLKLTGLRVSEVCRLSMAQRKSHAETGGVVFEKVLCKGNKERDVFMRDIGVWAMKNYIKEERGTLIKIKKTQLEKDRKSLSLIPDNIYLSYSGNPLSRTDIWRTIVAIAMKTIERIEQSEGKTVTIKAHPHSFRHERAYDILRAELGEACVAEELGHSTLNYVKRYTKRSDRARFRRLKDV
jgi:site-specific recombinase XerD